MKKITTILLSLVVSLAAFAQSNSHMKFMGIPMGISISSFQSKLASKGVKYDPLSRQMKDAVRLYNGKFAGYDASIYVYYDSKTQLVYRAKACIERGNKELADNIYFEMLDMLIKKYGIDNIYSVTQQDENDYGMCVETDNGRIDMYEVSVDADYYIHMNDFYTIHIDYFDDIAKYQNMKSRMDDL